MPEPRRQTGRLHCPCSQQPTLQPFIFFFWKGCQTGLSLCSCSDTVAAVFISPSGQGAQAGGEAAPKDPDKRQPCPGMMWPAPCRPALRLSTTAPGPSHLCLAWIPERASPKSVLMIARVTSCYFCFQNHLVASHLTQHEVHFLPQPVALTPLTSPHSVSGHWTPATPPPSCSQACTWLQALHSLGLPSMPSQGSRVREPPLATHPSCAKALLAPPPLLHRCVLPCPALPGEWKLHGQGGVVCLHLRFPSA